MTPEHYAVTFTVPDRSALEFQLDKAVAGAVFEALQEGTKGVLVTRHDERTFTVELSNDVPFGITQERTAPRRDAPC